MARPSVNFKVLSNGLGNVAASISDVIAVIGCTQSGTAATVYGPYSITGNLITDLGYGPASELAANLVQSGISTIVVKVNTNAVGVASSVVHAGSSSASVMTLTGTPLDAYSGIVQCTRAGVVGTAPEPGFKVTFDGGTTWSNEIRMPTGHVYTGFAATTGLTLNFSALQMTVGDTWTFSSTAPTWVAADVSAALDALKASELNAALLYLVGDCAESDANTIAPHVNAFVSARKFERIIVEARDIDVATSETEAAWMAAISADYAPFQSDLFVVAAGGALVPSTITDIAFRRNVGQLAIVRAGLVSPGHAINEVADGALVPTKDGSPTSVIFHNEGTVPGLDAERFLTVTSYNGKTGYFVTNDNIMSGPTSDFTGLVYGRVMDEACRIADGFFTELLGSSVRLSRKTGFILEKDAKNIESNADVVLNAGLVATGDASFVQTVLSRTDDISNTKTLTVTIEILPKGYVETVSATMTFINPAFGQLAA